MSKITYKFKFLKFQILPFSIIIFLHTNIKYIYIFSPSAEERKERDQQYEKMRQAYQDVTSQLRKAGTELLATFKPTHDNAGVSSSTDTSNGE